MGPRDRPVALPTVAAQRVQAAVIAGAGEGVRLDDPAVVPRLVGEGRPRQRRSGPARRDLGRRPTGCQRLARARVVAEHGLRRLAEQVVSGHYFFAEPSDLRSWQACTTRSAIPASADRPQARGSYCFFTPTSPSTFS